MKGMCLLDERQIQVATALNLLSSEVGFLLEPSREQALSLLPPS